MMMMSRDLLGAFSDISFARFAGLPRFAHPYPRLAPWATFLRSLRELFRITETRVADSRRRAGGRRHQFAAPMDAARGGSLTAVARREFQLWSRMMCMAGNRPGAAIIPPPGCVAEPHMYRFFMGVRYCAHPGTGRKKKSCSSESSP